MWHDIGNPVTDKDCDAKLGEFIDIERRRRIAVHRHFLSDFGNAPVVLVHKSHYFHDSGEQRVAIVIDRREVIRLGKTIQAARIGNFETRAVIIIEFNGSIAQLIIPMNDRIQQKFADCPVGIVIKRLLLQGGNFDRMRLGDADLDKGIYFVNGPQQRTFVGMFRKDIPAVIGTGKFHILNIGGRHIHFRVLPEEYHSQISRDLIFQVKKTKCGKLFLHGTRIITYDLCLDGLREIFVLEQINIQFIY